MARNMENGGDRRGNRWRPAIWGTAAGLLLLPLVAMRFTDEVNWTGSDFLVMGALLAAACGAYEFATRMSGNTVYRAAFAVAVLAAFLLVWVNLAVGVIGSEDNPANLMYLGVLAVAVVGAPIVRCEARGMARVMAATAAAQALAGVIAASAGWGMPDGGLLEIAGVTAFFMVPWLVSAALFRMASLGRLRPGAVS